MIHSLGLSALEGAQMVEQMTECAKDPNHANPAELGDAAFGVIMRGGLM